MRSDFLKGLLVGLLAIVLFVGHQSSAVDTFGNQAPGLNSPGGQSFTITPNDAADLPNVTRGLYVGSGGTVVVTLANDTTGSVTLTGTVTGTIYPLRVKRVWATNTTATNLVGIY